MGLLEENLDVTVCVKHMQMSKLKFFSHLVQFFFYLASNRGSATIISFFGEHTLAQLIFKWEAGLLSADKYSNSLVNFFSEV